MQRQVGCGDTAMARDHVDESLEALVPAKL